MNRDPIGEAGGLNLLEFVRNNPLYYFDPFGLVWYDDFGEWFQERSENAKDVVLQSTDWTLVATIVNSSVDLANSIAQIPKQIGHLGEATGEQDYIGDEPIFQPLRDLGEGIGTFSADPTLGNFAGVASDISVSVSVFAALKCPARAPPKTHKNSLEYVGETHVYRILDPNGRTEKHIKSEKVPRVYAKGMALQSERKRK